MSVLGGHQFCGGRLSPTFRASMMTEERRSKPVGGFKTATEKKQDRFSQEPESKDRPTRRRNRLDPLTEHLGCTGFFFKMRWPWFFFEAYGVKDPMEVDRFYHEQNLAIDIGNEDTPVVRERKRELLEENGIKYVCLQNEYDLKGLMGDA